jgi:hypothetical protein
LTVAAEKGQCINIAGDDIARMRKSSRTVMNRDVQREE